MLDAAATYFLYAQCASRDSVMSFTHGSKGWLYQLKYGCQVRFSSTQDEES